MKYNLIAITILISVLYTIMYLAINNSEQTILSNPKKIVDSLYYQNIGQDNTEYLAPVDSTIYDTFNVDDLTFDTVVLRDNKTILVLSGKDQSQKPGITGYHAGPNVGDTIHTRFLRLSINPK